MNLIADDMQVGEICLENVSKDDWNLDLLREHACFSHKKECEYILYVGDERTLHDYEDHGFTKPFVELCLAAAQKGFKYVCFYAG